jgi:hypothetical protein
VRKQEQLFENVGRRFGQRDGDFAQSFARNYRARRANGEGDLIRVVKIRLQQRVHELLALRRRSLDFDDLLDFRRAVGETRILLLNRNPLDAGRKRDLRHVRASAERH